MFSKLALLALAAAPLSLAGPNYIAETDEVGCQGPAGDCTNTQLIIFTGDDDSCDAVEHSTDIEGGMLTKGKTVKFDARDGFKGFEIHMVDGDGWDSKDEGHEVGKVKLDGGKEVPLKVHQDAGCKATEPTVSGGVSRQLVFED